MKAAAALLVNEWASSHGNALANSVTGDSPHVIVVACGGVRRTETFGPRGIRNIPHLFGDLLPRSLFFPSVRNGGVTSHYNTTSSILTGTWQRLDDWGKSRPANPTIFEYVRRDRKISQSDTWFISSNKALTAQIGASVDSNYGPKFGGNVIFPKQLLINAVVKAAAEGRAGHSADRRSMQPEIEAMLQADNFEGLGWSVFGGSSDLDEPTRATVFNAIHDLVQTSAPASGDEFTLLVSLEVMKRFAPALTVITFSDVEVAHFGSYSMHLAGIRTLDRLVYELWNEIQLNPLYKDRTTLFVLPEFGRDVDGSVTNGFFNHRLDNDSTRLTWMMCLGAGVTGGSVEDRLIEHVDLCPTIAHLFGVKAPQATGAVLPEIRV